MTKSPTGKKDYVRIASYLFFDEYKKERGGDVPGVMYNKFMTLLYAELKPEKDIGLPHCWYRWGDIVVAHCIPYITWTHKSPKYTIVEWNSGVQDYDPKDRIVSLIKKNIAEFMIRHSGTDAHETAKDEVYEGAPFKFQKEYRKMRESLDSMVKVSVVDNRTEYIGSLLLNAMKDFPKKEFKQIIGEKDKFEAVFSAGLCGDASSEDLFDFAELFWFFFCYHLRTNKKGHENVPKETLNIWLEEIPWETKRFEHILQNYAERFSGAGSDDPLILSLLEERKDRMERIKVLESEIFGDIPPDPIGRA
ncbi:MAG: hypothetical protein FWG41_05815 [Methanomassiliicoccaceae archaeon]|nr:hypothetical protein [Methanomassiliicoccaceae archaeon]